MTIPQAQAFLDATEQLVKLKKLPVPADAPYSMHLIQQAAQHLCDLGRRLERDFAPRPAFEALHDTAIDLPRKANEVVRAFLMASDAFQDLDQAMKKEHLTRPKQVTGAITPTAAGDVAKAALLMTDVAHAPQLDDGEAVMQLLAKTMGRFSTLCTNLDAQARANMEDPSLPQAVIREYDSLSSAFIHGRHHANETKKVFDRFAAGYVALAKPLASRPA